MKFKRRYLIAALIVLAVLVSACQTVDPTAEPVQVEPSLTPAPETEAPETEATKTEAAETDSEETESPRATQVQDQAGGGAERMVEVLDSEFGPEEIIIQPGTTVVWNQTGSISHTVTADQGLFDSGNMEKGDTFSFTFEEEGTYPYYCVYHGGPGGKGMSGIIIVSSGGEGGTEVEAGEDGGEDTGEDETDSLY